jgi:hypothetical protein
MISADHIVDRCSHRLGLHKRDDVEPQDLYSSVAEALLEIQIRAQDGVDSLTVSTVAAQDEYPLDEEVFRVDSISWPTTWGYPVQYVSPQKMRDIQSEVSSFSAVGTTQPEFYTLRRERTGVLTLILSPGAYVAAGLAISVKFSAAQLSEIEAGTDIAITSSMTNLLKAGACWQMAIIYRPEVAAYWEAEFDKQFIYYWQSQSIPTNERLRTNVQEF